MITKVLTAVAAVALSAPLFAQAPGTLTYVEGQAAVAGAPINGAAAGRTTLTAGQMLSTGNGTAEVELTRGALLRLDRSTSVKAVALEGKHTEIQLNSGRAEINVAGLAQGSELQIDTPNGAQTLLVKDGLYEFDAKNNLLRVFDGKAAVSNSASSGKWIDVKAGRQLALGATSTVDFDRDQASDGFARRTDSFISRGGGYGYGPGYGEGEFAYGYPGYYGYGYPYGLYSPYTFGFYPGFYGGFGGYYRGGFGYGGRGFGGGGFRR